jgi:hypothetical protein
VTVEVSYEDALRLWLLVHDPANAGTHPADARLRKIVHDAVSVVEEAYEEASDAE